MGCTCSFSRPPPDRQVVRQRPDQISSSPTTGNGDGSSSNYSAIRVVNMNGYVEDLLLPPPTPNRKTKGIITPRDVIGPPSSALTARSSVLCSSSQLRSMGMGCFAPLPLDDALRPDELYFVLPSSLFHSSSSSFLDLVSFANRLAAIARDPSTPVDLRDVGADRWVSVPRLEERGRGAWKPDLDAIEEVSLSGSLSRSSINPGSIDPLPN